MVGYLWSNGVQGTNNRQKNSVWIMTVTLSLLSEHAASKYHIGVLTLGSSKNNHQPVFDHITNEVSQLHTPKLCYCKLTNSFQWVTFGLFFYLADIPEHDAQLNLLGHGGATSIYDHPKASIYCALLNGYPTTQMSNIDPPMHRTANEQHLVPHQSSFEWLSRGVQLAEMEVRLGNWSKGQCDAYLHSMGLNITIS